MIAPDSTAGTKTVTSLGWLGPTSWSPNASVLTGTSCASRVAM
jgi:hypothetical protein